jgi:hypothetical protein
MTDQSIVAIATRLPIAMRSESCHLHRHFGHKNEAQTGADGDTGTFFSRDKVAAATKNVPLVGVL